MKCNTCRHRITAVTDWCGNENVTAEYRSKLPEIILKDQNGLCFGYSPTLWARIKKRFNKVVNNG